jgi:hypothetical protein
MADLEQLLIRFRGICGHINLSNGGNGNEKNKKRTVLVRHQNGNADIEHHVAYVEFFADDVKAFSPDLKIIKFSRPGVDGRFARVEINDATEIRLKGIPAGEVEEALSYQRDVPHMGEILKRKIDVAKSLLTGSARDIDQERAVAVFDMPEGRLVAGEPEALVTRFPPEVGFKARRLARWSDLYITYEPPLVLELTSLEKGGAVREIEFESSLRMITIGNEPERLIVGIIGAPSDQTHHHDASHDHNGAEDEEPTPVQPTGHYVLYYNLLENPPTVKPVPIPTQFEGSGCPNNNYP